MARTQDALVERKGKCNHGMLVSQKRRSETDFIDGINLSITN